MIAPPRREPRRRARARRRFDGAPFGPHALRAVARDRFEPGECFLGWGPVSIAPSPWTTAMVALLSALPVAGVILAAEVSRSRLLVLTDRRLLLIDPKARRALDAESLADAEIPLAGLAVELTGSARTAADIDHFENHPFRATLRPDGRAPIAIRFTIGKRTASRRLPEALRLLARPPGEPPVYAEPGD